MSTLILEIFQIFCILYFISIFYTFKTILFILHFLFSCAFLLLRFICFRHQMHKNSPHSIHFESCGEFNRVRQTAKRIANILINPCQATLRITTIRFVLLFCLFIDKLKLRLGIHDLLAVIKAKITGLQIADRHRNQKKRHTVKSK